MSVYSDLILDSIQITDILLLKINNVPIAHTEFKSPKKKKNLFEFSSEKGSVLKIGEKK